MARTVDEARHRAKREQILHAAAGLFAAHGFDGTSTAAICRAAGISPGNLYHYFSSKREIFAAVVTDDDDETAERLTAALADDDPWDGLLGFVDHLVAPAAEPVVPNLVLEAMLQAYRDAELARLLERDAQDEQAGVAALVTRATDAGQIAPGLDAAHAASWITTLVGMVYLRAALDEDFDPAEQMPTFHLLVERILRRRPD